MRSDARVSSGDLRNRVTIQYPVYNSPPDEIASWADLATVWAAVEPAILPAGINRNEQFRADREVSRNDVLIRIRWYPGVDTTMRVVHGSTAYDIRDVADVNSLQTTMHLLCRAVR